MEPSLLSEWLRALSVFAASSVGREHSVYYEQRADLRLELAPDGSVARFPGFRQGLALRSASPERPDLHVSAPNPGDLHRIAAGTGDLADPAAVDPPPETPAGGSGLLLALAAAASRHGGVAPLARTVAFDQTVIVADPGQEPVSDRRRGRRLRLQLGPAVIERDLRSGDPDPRGLIDDLLRRAVELSDARPLPPGEYPTVFAPGVGGVLLHELVGHALEADLVLQGRSWLTDFLSDRRAPDDWTVIDDPRRGRAPAKRDDEGVATRATPLLHGGRVAGRLHCRRTAAASDREPNGHGRVGSYRDPVMPRMGATFQAPGAAQADGIVADVVDGIYVCRMEAAHTDTARGDAVFRVTDADRIRDGRRAETLMPFLLHAEGPQLLSRPVVIGDDLAFDTCMGSCHKDGQPLVATVGAPTIWIEVMKVRGSNLNPGSSK